MAVTQVYLKKLTLGKFRKIDNMSMEFTPGVNMIVGHNGTGKSNILSLITSGTGSGRSTLAPKYDNYFKIDNTEIFSEYSVDNLYSTTDPESPVLFKTHLSFKKDSGKRVAHVVPRLQPVENIDTDISDAVKRFNIFFDRSSSGSAKLPIPTKFISVSRLTPRGEVSLKTNQYTFSNTDALEKYIDWYNSILPRSISINEKNAYEVRKEADHKKVEIKLIDTPASGVSVGQDSLSTIISALTEILSLSENNDYKGSIIAIDEFDLSLHADAQNKLVDLLIDLSKTLKIQFFISTHSLTAIRHFSRSVNRNPLLHTLIYIKDRTQPFVDDKADYYRIAESMYLTTNTLAPKITVYTEDESGLKLLNMYISTFSQKILPDIDTAFTFIPMKASKSILKYLNTKDAHFQSSLIVYDGDARYRSNGENESNATKGEYILGIKKLELAKTDKIGQNASILPSGFAPEAFIFFWLNKLVNDRTSLSRDFWRMVNNNSSLERAYYEKQFTFDPNIITTDYLKEHYMNDLFDFAEKTRLLEFLYSVETEDAHIIDFRKQLDDFIIDFNRSIKHVIGRRSASAFID